MQVQFDWKFFLTLALTIAGVVVPVWLWQADLASKALLLQIRSVAELQPQSVGALDGLQVTVDGKVVKTPFVSVLELSNIGTKPIMSADFESPITVQTTAPSRLVKAQISTTVPSSLAPKAEVKDGVLVVHALLLNPGDTLKFTVVTSESRPTFLASGRIAGVQEIQHKDSQANGIEIKRWLTQCVAFLLFVIYAINLMEVAYSAIRRRTFLPYDLATGIVAGLGAAILFAVTDSTKKTDFQTIWPLILFATIISLVH